MKSKELLKALEGLENLNQQSQSNKTSDLKGLQYQEGVQNLNHLRKEQGKLYKTINSLFLKYCINANQMSDYNSQINSMNEFD